MKRSSWYMLWLAAYLLCAGLGFLPTAEGIWIAVRAIVAVLFFVPGFYLVYDAKKRSDKKAVSRLRLVCGLSLGLTLAVFIANIAAANGADWLGDLLYVLLVLVSSPMVFGHYWILSLFLWASLLIFSFVKNPDQT